jgi:single-stranded-DNA-specific exonuclease
LIGVNRAFVRQGLKVMSQRKRVGLNALSDVAGLNAAPSAYHLGYVLGPRINAGGRIGKADLGARLLACNNPHEAAVMADKLEELNTERRSVEAMVRLAALEQAEARGLESPLAWAAQDGWHPGVVGIVAARLKEKTNRPAVVIGFDGDSGKGSGRSVSGIDLGAAIHKLAREGLITREAVTKWPPACHSPERNSNLPWKDWGNCWMLKALARWARQISKSTVR